MWLTLSSMTPTCSTRKKNMLHVPRVIVNCSTIGVASRTHRRKASVFIQAEAHNSRPCRQRTWPVNTAIPRVSATNEAQAAPSAPSAGIPHRPEMSPASPMMLTVPVTIMAHIRILERAVPMK